MSLFEQIKPASISWHNEYPFADEFNDIYFSTSDGLSEAEYVFIHGNRLIERWQELSHSKSTLFVIAETGFGSGLNFLLTWYLWRRYAPQKAQLYYFSCEKYPLTLHDLSKCLSKWPKLCKEASDLLKIYPPLTPGLHYLNFEDSRVHLNLMFGDAIKTYESLLVCGEMQWEARLRHYSVDAWFLDGFAPSKNPDMWDESLLTVIGLLSKKNTTLATFTAAGEVRRRLQKIGFIVKKIPGFGRKREMIVARYTQNNLSVRNRVTPWHMPDRQRNHLEKKVLIVGAGLAGCYTANALAKRGWAVTLLEANKQIAKGASDNAQGIVFPRLSPYRSPFTEFMLVSFLYSSRIYEKILQNWPIGKRSGILQLLQENKLDNAWEELEKWLSDFPQLGKFLTPEQATEIAGVSIETSALYIPDSCWMDMNALCHNLIENKNIRLETGVQIETLVHDGDLWCVESYQAPALILANGHRANRFAQTRYLPIKPIRGQMTQVQATPDSQKLALPLCGQGHILPVNKNKHYIGATYGLGSDIAKIYPEDDEQNIKKIKSLAVNWQAPEIPVNQWVGIRAATPDYLPLVGPVSVEAEFLSTFASLNTNALRWVEGANPVYQGLYICAGFGSRGLTSIPVCSEYLASLLDKNPPPLTRSLIQAISPARFLRRNIVRKQKP